MEKQEKRKTSLGEKNGTCSVGWVVPSTSGDSELAGGGHLEVADVVVGLGTVGMDQWSTPELPGSLERSFAARRRISLQWVLKKQPEVDRSVCYPSDQEEDAGELLEGS